MKYLFFVQADGRGHMTQALALAEELRQRNHELVAIIMNDNPTRQIPDFFREGIGAPIYHIKSPYFIINKEKTGINFGRSVIFNLLRAKAYAGSLHKIKKIYQETQPDIIINFFEPLAGIYNFFHHPKIISFSVGHQFFVEHPAFKKPKGHFKDRLGFIFYNHLTAYGSCALLALSFTKEKDYKRIIVCPPLIREEIKALCPRSDNFILSYVLNYGCYHEIEQWAIAHPAQKIEAFWDKKGVTEPTIFGPNLIFYPISGQKFLDRLESCTTYISTGGFDSISEAAYLQKNILMVPTKNHYEQLCNAHDALRAGLAIFDTHFNISRAIKEQKTRSEQPGRVFKTWVDDNQDKIINLITQVSIK
jgi:uncharacterized protein (TIGR00661 family)